MLNRILGGISLAAVLATGLSAQTQTATTFQYLSGGPTSNGGGNPFNMMGKLTGTPTPVGSNWVVGTAFEVWCVDQTHFVSGSSVNVNISRMDGSASETRTGDMTRYQKAAYFASTMTTTNKFTNQYVMWSILHGKTAGENCKQWDGAAFAGANFVNTCDGNNIASIVAGAGPVTTTSEWFVITGATDAGTTHGGVQELIARCTPLPGTNTCDTFNHNTEEAPTPEPATMSLVALGLAGMAGATFRRRRIKG